MTTTREKIIAKVDQIETTLLQKNEAYGDSANNPIRLFSKASPKEQLLVRLDDKISRIARGTNHDAVPEDTILDLIGYLVLLSIAQDDEKAAKTSGSYTASFEVTDMDPDAWIALTEGTPRAGGAITTLPVRIDPFWEREHP